MGFYFFEHVERLDLKVVLLCVIDLVHQMDHWDRGIGFLKAVTGETWGSVIYGNNASLPSHASIGVKNTCTSMNTPVAYYTSVAKSVTSNDIGWFVS